MATFDKFISSLEKEYGPQGKGKKFEVFCKWFLQNEPQWSRVVDQVWHFEEYPDKWQTNDLGTDLVFKDKQGEIWAVQVKCFDEKYSTKKDDMNTFLADSGRKQVSRRLWLQSTNKIDARALQTSKDQEKPVVFFNLNDFREAQIDYPDSFDDLFEAKVKDKPTPDKHQEIAINDVVEGLKQSDRGQLIMACGTGKTFTTLWIKEALDANSTLVLLPSLGLLSQTLHEWAWAGNAEFEVLNVCSDQSVGRDPEDLKTTDAPFRVTSDIEEIASFLANPNPKVLFCTYQSSGLIAEVHCKQSIPAFNLVIADEAHRCAGKVSSDYANVLNDQKIRSEKRLFTTATPRFIGQNIKARAKDRDVEIVDMNDAAVFGSVLHKLNFGEAIHYEPEPLLNDYRVLVIGVDEPMVKKWIKNYELVSFENSDATDARTLAAKIAVIKAMKDYDLKRIISFHSKIDTSKSFAETFLDTVDLVDENERPTGVILADHVSGKMKASDRKEKIKRLKKLSGIDRGLLANARCLSEGVDVPSLDGVAFIDPKGSQVDIIQSVGRAIRKVRGARTQTKGTIILPVFLEESDDPNEVINKSNFKPVWNVLTALKSHDDELSDKLDEYRINLGKTPTRNVEKISDKIIFDLPLSVGKEFSNALNTKIVELTTNSWEFWYGSLLAFVEEFGHAQVTKSYRTKSGENLGVWVSKQRTKYLKNKLTPEQFFRLDSLPNFTWDLRETRWLEQYLEFKSSLESIGKTKTGRKFKAWVDSQRQSYKAGTINKKRIGLLEELIDWQWDPYNESWQKNYNIIQRVGAINLLRSKKLLSEEEKGVASWAVGQRLLFKNGKLETERIKLLEQLDYWAWDIDEALWMHAYNALENLLITHPNFDFPADAVTLDGRLVSGWIGRIRTQYNKNQLPKAKIRLMEKLDNWSWSPLDKAWELGFQRLQAFISKNSINELRNSFVDETGFNLGMWVSTQRRRYQEKYMTDEQVKRLETIDGWIWKHEVLWDKNFALYKELLEKQPYPYLRQTLISRDGVNMSSWASKQRHKYNLGQLEPQRVKLLESIKGWTWEPAEKLWEVSFEALEEFVEKNGGLGGLNSIPETPHKHGGNLKTFVRIQRRNYRTQKLSKEKIAKLEKINGWSW